MQVSVHAFGMVGSVLGKKVVHLDLPEGATVREAINEIVQLGGPEAKKLILAPDGESLKISVIIDGKSAGLTTPLYDGVDVNLMVTIGGGTIAKPRS